MTSDNDSGMENEEDAEDALPRVSIKPEGLSVSTWLSNLASDPKLKSLIIYFNNIGDEGAATLASSSSLTSLSLVHNRICERGATALQKSKLGVAEARGQSQHDRRG